MIPIYAGFWRRCAAFVLDGIVLWIPNFLLGQAMPSGVWGTFAISLVLGLAYYAGLHSSPMQATLGKLAFGIKVTDNAGKRLGIGAAVARYFATWLSALTLGIGFLLAAFTDRKRALHDIACGTLVVNRDTQPEDLVESNKEVMAVTWPVWAVVLLLFALPLVGGLVAVIAMPVYQDYALRTQLANEMARVENVKQEVNDTLAARKSVRPGRREIVSPLLQEVEVDAAGQVTVTLSPDRLGGGRVFMAPLVSKSTRSEWRCWAEGVAPRYMPAVCRE